MAVGLYTDESFVYRLVNAWANDTSANQARGLRYVGPFMRRLIEAMPRCCDRYSGPAVRVLKAGGRAPQVMRDAFADYEHQFAEGTVLHFRSFVSFARGSTAEEAFTDGSSIVLFCKAIEAFDVDRYSMMTLAHSRTEKEVLCLAPSAFRVSQPPTKTKWTVTVYTDMEGAPPCHPDFEDVSFCEVERIVGHLSDVFAIPHFEMFSSCYKKRILLARGTDASGSIAIVDCDKPTATQRILALASCAHALILNNPTGTHLKALRETNLQCQALALVNVNAPGREEQEALRDALTAASTVPFIAVNGDCSLEGCTLHNNVRSLSVTWCSNLTDANVKELTADCSQLQSLDFSGCENLTDATAMEIAHSHLQSLNLHGCSKLTDVYVMQTVSSCKQLQSIDFSNCQLTDATVVIIAGFCPHLQSLDVSSCNLHDACIMEVAVKCPKLQSLYVRACNQLTDACVVETVAKCPGLQSLDISECKRLTNASMIEIAAHCTQLVSLNAV